MIERIVLVKPPDPGTPFNFGTFSLAVLAAAVRERAAVSIVDATAMAEDEAVAAVWAQQPDLIGVTVMSYASAAPVSDYVRRLCAARDGRPVPVIVGGHGVSMHPDEFLHAGADAAVIGEGENSLREIVERGVRPGTPGTVCAGSGGRVIAGPARPPIAALDDLPMPARDLIAPPADGVHLLETSRGCPHACAFCEATLFYGRRWRAHSPERVVAEVAKLVHVHEATIILLADDNFTASPRRVRRICELLRAEDLPLLFMVAARADDLIADPELLPAMARARMLRVCVGVETLDATTAERAGKPIAPDVYRRTFERMRALGMFSMASLIVGLPGETAEARERAVERLAEAGPDSAQFVPFQAFPGTPLGGTRSTWEPDPTDTADAVRLTADFYRRPAVRARLEEAAAGGDLRALLARGILNRQTD